MIFPRVSLEVFEIGLQWDHAALANECSGSLSVSSSCSFVCACSFVCDCE